MGTSAFLMAAATALWLTSELYESEKVVESVAPLSNASRPREIRAWTAPAELTPTFSSSFRILARSVFEGIFPEDEFGLNSSRTSLVGATLRVSSEVAMALLEEDVVLTLVLGVEGAEEAATLELLAFGVVGLEAAVTVEDGLERELAPAEAGVGVVAVAADDDGVAIDFNVAR